MIVRVNDRGPYHGNRVMDVSQRVAETLDFKRRWHRADPCRLCRPARASAAPTTPS